MNGKTDYIEFVFDGPPGPQGPRLVEVEDAKGRSIKAGEWRKRPDGFWALRVSLVRSTPETQAHLEQAH